jgi:pimeloyl-ACP methyl ester carboxylesterase
MGILVDEQVIEYKYGNTGYYGKTVVMIHGWGDTLDTFELLQREVGKEYGVISLDLPGFGKSSPPNKPWHLDDYAKIIASFLEKKGRKHTYCFIGHSNGCAILIRGLATGVLEADKLVLMASAGIRDQEKTKKSTLKLATKSGKVASSILPKGVRSSLRKKYYDAIGSEMLLFPELEQTFKNVVGQDIQEDAAKLTLPTLIIYGEDDTVTPPKYGGMLHNLIQGSKLEIVEQAGHFVHRDAPDDTANLIKDFLK